jgi:hypothetical protein
MRIYGFLIPLILLLVLPLPLSTLRAETGNVPPSFIVPLMNWVVAHTNVRVPTIPTVLVSREAMVEKIGDPYRQSALARALYVPGEVVIDDTFWDPSDVRAVSFLVHELVHHAQLYRGIAYACNNTKEYEAYRLQNQYLAEHGEEPVVDEKWIATMARCDGSNAFFGHSS